MTGGEAEDMSWLDEFCAKLSPAEKSYLVDHLARAGVDEDESIHEELGEDAKDEMIPLTDDDEEGDEYA